MYLYDSAKEREEGLEDFRIITETANVPSFKINQAKNVLFFLYI